MNRRRFLDIIRPMFRSWIAGLGLLVLVSCAPLPAQPITPTVVNESPTAALPATQPPTSTATIAPATAAPTPASSAPAALFPSASANTSAPSVTPDVRLSPENWQEWSILPTLSARAKALYQAGLQQGNNPHAFSKVGDCQNITSHFLAAFDDPQLHKLGDKFENLQPALEQFKGMFKRESAAVRNGFNVAAVLSPVQADPSVCKVGETPLSCELRINKPSIVLISMETWWAKKPAQE